MAIEPSFRQEIEEREKVMKSKKLTQQETIPLDWPSPDLSSNSSSRNKESSQGESESEKSSDSSSRSGSIGNTKYSDLRSRSEHKKTPRKTRLRKLSSLGSFRSSRRGAKSRFENGPDPNSIEVSDASPSHYSQTSSHNSQMEKFSRTSSLRTKRVLKKNKSSFKPAKQIEVSLDPGMGKATYSSILKDSKFPKVEDEAEKNEVMKVCPYHHCSLYGHHHHDSPDRDPPKRFEYLKRRSVMSHGIERSQMKTAVKRSGKRREEEGKGRKALSNVGYGEDFSIEFYAKTRSEPILGATRENEDAVLADILFGVRSLQGNQNDNRDSFAEGIDIREGTGWGSCFVAKKMEESCSEAVYKDFGDSSMKGGDKISTIEEKTANLNVKLKEDENATSSASNLHPSEKCNTNIEERSCEISLDGELVDGFSQRDSEPNISEVNKSRVKKVNRLSMWHMIHRQMVSGLASEAGNDWPKKPDEVKEVCINDPKKLPERKDFGSQTNFSDSDMGNDQSQDLASQEVEIRKMFAIKLVREAIEKILLPEVQDDQSITSDVTSEQDLSEKNQGEEGGEELEKMNKKVAVEEGKKSESRAPKRWSYLKKVILLNKFIKELEKVKKYTSKKPKNLHLEPEKQAEMVSLRRGLIGEKKNSEEWMLDFALRKVVSELAPMQKRKVGLLVKAFETVAPTQEEEQKIKVAIPKLRSNIPKGSSQPLPEDIKEQDSNSVHVASSNCEPLDGEEKNNESKLEGIFPRAIPFPLGSKLESTAKGEQGEDLDRTKRLEMWHMIYQHVITNISEKVGTQVLLDEEDEEVNNEKKFPSIKASENHDAISHDRLELKKSVAVKLVQEAVNEILLPEVQEDSSDTQSVASNISLSQEDVESADGASTMKNKLDSQKSKNWSKLKKLIILKRSIRALEQVRKVNLRRPQKPSLVSDDEKGEKVDLRSQMTDERKKAEQWMLDYAVRHIVTTLTPARKRRVAMLVEAFEAVVPLPEV